MRTYGSLQSNLEGVDEYQVKPIPLPDKYRLKMGLRPILNQGDVGCCASVAITDIANYSMQLKRKDTSKIKFDKLYYLRKNKSLDGMSMREAVEIYSSSFHEVTYAKVGNLIAFKTAILTNGPIAIGLPVRDIHNDMFWRGNNKQKIGHAVVLEGWDKNGFLLKNSWGYTYGHDGYITFPYEDFGSIFECWTVF